MVITIKWLYGISKTVVGRVSRTITLSRCCQMSKKRLLLVTETSKNSRGLRPRTPFSTFSLAEELSLNLLSLSLKRLSLSWIPDFAGEGAPRYGKHRIYCECPYSTSKSIGIERGRTFSVGSINSRIRYAWCPRWAEVQVGVSIAPETLQKRQK